MKLKNANWARVVAAWVLAGFGLSAQAAPVSGQGTWETTLLPRSLDGNAGDAEAYYDTVLGITWLANANYAGTLMDWTTANAWAATLDFNGIDDWRLPMMTTGGDACGFAYSGTNCGYNVDTASSEMAHLFYVTLGDKAYYDTSGNGPQAGWGLTNTGPFSNVQSDYYWSATEYAPIPGFAWSFNFYEGFQPGLLFGGFGSYAWAVHTGDVGAAVVPVPAAVWLMGSGLMGLLSWRRRTAGTLVLG